MEGPSPIPDYKRKLKGISGHVRNQNPWRAYEWTYKDTAPWYARKKNTFQSILAPLTYQRYSFPLTAQMFLSRTIIGQGVVSVYIPLKVGYLYESIRQCVHYRLFIRRSRLPNQCRDFPVYELVYPMLV